MERLSKYFFTDQDLLFVGYSERNRRFSQEIYRGFTNRGIKVYPLNTKENGNYDIKVYQSFTELPSIPKTAYILLNKENTKKVIPKLSDQGVKRVLFHSKKTVDSTTFDQCKGLGMEAAMGCPLMVLGSGIHRIHGFFAGVR